jgi:hypothetical protein
VKKKVEDPVSEVAALVPPDVIQKKTGGFLWPPRPEMPDQHVPDYAANLEKNMTGASDVAKIQANARTTWLREGVLDYVRATQDPALWDLETGMLRPEAKTEIVGRLDRGLADLAFDPEWIKSVSIMGSMVGRQYRSDSDVDVEVLIDQAVPEGVLQGAVDYFTQAVSGKPLPGTKHPVNFFLTKTPPPMATIEGKYDLTSDRWTKDPVNPPENFDPEEAYSDAYKAGREIADEIGKLFGELRRDVQDMQELKSLDSAFADDLQLKKLHEINETVLCLTRIGKILWRVRDDAFKAGGDPQRSPENLLYKFVDKSGELARLHKLGDVRSRYVDDLAAALNVGGHDA